MEIKIVFLKSVFEKLKSALEWDGKEKSAKVLCHSSVSGNKIKLLPKKIIVPGIDDYVQRTPVYYELTKSFTTRVINEAINKQMDVLNCHNHPGLYRVGFSRVDEVREPMFMGDVEEQVENIYQASVVFPQDFSSLDSWYFHAQARELVPVDKVLVIRKNKLDVFIPPRSPLYRKYQSSSVDERHNRTALAVGPDGVRKLSLLDVGVIGCSGTGAIVIEQWARMGVRRIVLCDPDLIDESNLNRLPWTTTEDIGRNKAEFYAEVVKKINPSVEVVWFNESFYSASVQQAFAQCDLIFGCVDGGARFSVNRLASANLIPYFDLGSSIVSSDGKMEGVAGQVYILIPGVLACLNCLGVFANQYHEFLFIEDKKLEIRQGYVQGEDIKQPSVYDLNMIVSALAVSSFRKYVLGFGRDVPENKVQIKTYLDLLNESIMPTYLDTTDLKGCVCCKDFLGMGSKVPLLFPQKKSLEIDQIREAS